jgi:uncharacterized protein YjbI with pentapeptide repeats
MENIDCFLRRFPFDTWTKEEWDREPITRPDAVYVAVTDDGENIRQRRLTLDKHTETYRDLDALVELEFLAGNLGKEPPIVFRPGMEMAEFLLSMLSFKRADLRGVKFRNISLQATSLEGADLRGAILDNCHMYNCDLSGADLREASIIDTSICLATTTKRTDFTDATLEKPGKLLPPLGWSVQGGGNNRLYRSTPRHAL